MVSFQTNKLTDAPVAVFTQQESFFAVALKHAIMEFVAELLAGTVSPALPWNKKKFVGKTHELYSVSWMMT